MADDLAAQLERMASGEYRPATFLERGVAVPFTTPMLLGARLRPASRNGYDLVIASISGGRGFYIVSWSALAEICAPSLHDERLYALLAPRASLSPENVRRASSQVAQEGWGGRFAARAADHREAEAEAETPLARMRLNLRLLQRLVRQTETPAEATPPIEADAPDRQQHRSKRALLRVSARLGLRPEEVILCFEEIALAFQHVGVPEEPRTPRLRQILAQLDHVAGDFAEWVARTPAARENQISAAIAGSCTLTVRCGAALLGRIEGDMADITALLGRWQTKPESLAVEATRLDWLLDGWPLIIALWQQSKPRDRLRTAKEIAMLLPILPRETAAWCGMEADWDLPQRLCRFVPRLHDWRHGRMVDLMARNERLMALAL